MVFCRSIVVFVERSSCRELCYDDNACLFAAKPLLFVFSSVAVLLFCLLLVTGADMRHSSLGDMRRGHAEPVQALPQDCEFAIH